MAVKKLSPKQKKIAAVRPPRNKITGADFKGLGSRKRKNGKKRV
tara:strand:- start:679 stop:810 length:132 start_codon:yes stop_codon:yes gene_type:complete